MPRLLSPAAAAVLVLLAAAHAFAQATVSVTGRVTDPQGAAAPGAAVTVRQVRTGLTRSAQTDTDGRFAVPMLAPGAYEVVVQLTGFTPWRSDALTLLAGQDRHLEPRLEPAGIRETVVVREERVPLTTAVDDVIAAPRIDALPLNGRNFLELALLAPGNQPAPTFDPTKTNSVLIASAGQLGRGANITIDGQSNNDDVVGGPLLNLPIDAVQEFQIATSGFGAGLGRSASSVINVITRAGTNEQRGTASAYARHHSWQAGPSTIDEGAGTPPFDRQQWSAALGGPLRANQVFWFAAGELRNQDGALLVGERDVATRSIVRRFVTAPLDDALWFVRVDAGGPRDQVTVRYAGEHATDTAASALERALGSATQRQDATNGYNSVLGTWRTVPSSTVVNALHASASTFRNTTVPVAARPQLTFPSLQDGASFRMPQETRQTRIQIANDATLVRGAHLVRIGGAVERVDGEFRLGVFQQGRIEMVQDFPEFDHTGDGIVDDNDLLFAVTLRSGRPDRPLEQPDADNVHVAGYVQDDWMVSSRLQVNAGLRYEFDTDVNNQSRVGELNPIVLPFVTGERRRDANNVAPRLGVAWTPGPSLVVRAGYGISYDRLVLQLQSLERGLDGRALPIEVRAGNVFFLDPQTGRLPSFAPTLANPFTGFILPGAGASGITILDPHLQSPMVHELHVGMETALRGLRVRVDGIHNQGTHFLIGRIVGEVFNPVVGGPDRVVNIESSARTKYDALLVSADREAAGSSIRVAYTLAKSFNYANDDQIPFLNGPIDPTDLRREFGPAPHDRRHRFVASGVASLPGGLAVSGIWTLSSGVPMDIMMPDAQTRVPLLQRNAGGRLFTSAAALNAFITAVNEAGGIDGAPLPLVSPEARFTDSFNSLDLRLSRPVTIGDRVRVEPMLEIFNLLNVENVLGTTNVNYSGFSSVLTRDSDDPAHPGFLRSSAFGRPVSTAGGVFGSGGPRALQIAARVTF